MISTVVGFVFLAGLVAGLMLGFMVYSTIKFNFRQAG